MSTQQQYTRGFNSGYVLAKYNPNLLIKVVKGLAPTTEYLGGFFSGKLEYELENLRQETKDVENIRAKKKNIELER